VLDVQIVNNLAGNKRLVINSYNNGFVSGATVNLTVYDGISPERTVTPVRTGVLVSRDALGS